MARIILSPKEIAERQFKTVLRGYDGNEVDDFLDDVIKDYETYMAEIQALRKENEELRAQVKTNFSDTSEDAFKTQTYSAGYEQQSDIERVSSAVTNFDILKRISRLEKEVFGKDIVE